MKYNLVKENPTWIKGGEHLSPENEFKSGHAPWNKGLKGIHLNPETEFKKGEARLTGENNCKWRGDDVGYFGLHSWVYRHLGKATKCSECGSIKNVHWANKSYEYRRVKEDWQQLCCPCHGKKDTGNRGMIKRRFGT